MTRAQLQASVAARLGSPAEARWLLEEVLGPEAGRPGPARGAVVDDDRIQRVEALVARRRSGEPLQYLVGHWAFRRLDLVVDPRVLIPRPETEQLVDVALDELARLVSRPGSDGAVVVDLGTGSGAIALALAVEATERWPDLRVLATDASADALAVAEENRDRVAATWPAARKVTLAGGRWWDAVDPAERGRVDLVVSNPPYVAEADFPGLDPTVRLWEPRGALVAPDRDGVSGLGDIAAVLADAATWLRPGGVVVVEIDPGQADGALGVARRAGLVDGRTEDDLAGRVRMVVARR